MVADGAIISLEGVLPKEVGIFFESAGAYALKTGRSLAVVGGPVRDWLLGIQIYDCDFLVGGDALHFVRDLHAEWTNVFPDWKQPALGHPFPQFGTIKLLLAEPLGLLSELDFASSRREMYPRPGRSPEVIYPVSLREDLGRRDFTMNSLAIQFVAPGKGMVLDPFQGAADVTSRTLRVLHERSFLDDPARIIRALRFANRLGLAVAPETAALMDAALSGGSLRTLTAQRLFDELRKGFNEHNLARLLHSFKRAGVLEQIHPGFVLPEEEVIREVERRVGKERHAALLGRMLPALSTSEYESLLKSWGLSRKLAAEFSKGRQDVV